MLMTGEGVQEEVSSVIRHPTFAKTQPLRERTQPGGHGNVKQLYM